MHLKTAIGLAPFLTAALVGVAEGQSASCGPYQRYISVLKSFDLPFVTSACSSLLQYPRDATQTVTQTATNTKTVTVATTTNFVAAQTKTRRNTQTVTTTTTQTVTLTNTVTSYHYSIITETSTFKAAVTPRAVEARDSDKQWRSFGLPESIASQACSCLVTKPTGVATKTKTVTVTENSRQSVTATVEKKSGTAFITQTTITTATNFDVQGIYTYVTEHPDSTLTVTVTSCAGAYPPSFNLQVVDATATRTDSYNSLYASPTPNPNYFPDYPFYTLGYLSKKPQGVGGDLFNIDCLGRLHVQAPGGGKVLYAAVSYFQPGFELVYWMDQFEIAIRHYLYVYCSRDAAGFLNCSTPQPSPSEPLTMFQTCPLYDEYFASPLVFANYQSPDAPMCYGLKFKAV